MNKLRIKQSTTDREKSEAKQLTEEQTQTNHTPLPYPSLAFGPGFGLYSSEKTMMLTTLRQVFLRHRCSYCIRRKQSSSSSSSTDQAPPGADKFDDQSNPPPLSLAPSSTHYDLLGILPDATTTEVREAFYQKAKLLHPDINPDPRAREQFEQMQEAFKVGDSINDDADADDDSSLLQVLRDKEARDLYDQKEDIETALEKRAEELEVYWMHRKRLKRSFGRGWDEKLVADLMRGSALRLRQTKDQVRNRLSWCRLPVKRITLDISGGRRTGGS